MTTKPDDDIAAFLTDWTTAETGRDVETLDRQLAPDFTGIGPLGFTLTKTNWLDRHATGALTYNTFRLEELHLRAYGDTAVVTAHQITEGTYQGHPLPGQLRVTEVPRGSRTRAPIGSYPGGGRNRDTEIP